MAKVKKEIFSNKIHYRIECPGCKTHHFLDERWKFNGDYEKPTFSPSLDYNGGRYEDHEVYIKLHCHSFIKDGKIRFLNDCSHELKGQTVDLLDIKNNGK